MAYEWRSLSKGSAPSKPTRAAAASLSVREPLTLTVATDLRLPVAPDADPGLPGAFGDAGERVLGLAEREAGLDDRSPISRTEPSAGAWPRAGVRCVRRSEGDLHPSPYCAVAGGGSTVAQGHGPALVFVGAEQSGGRSPGAASRRRP